MKKLPENPFKETEKLVLDIADKTDKALIDSLNDLIKAGILEVKYLVPHSEFNENYLTVKSGVQVVPKFDEYTKKLESENSELKKQLSHEKDLKFILKSKIEELTKKCSDYEIFIDSFKNFLKLGKEKDILIKR